MIIRVYHGVTSTGSWFLLADVEPQAHDDDTCGDSLEPDVDDTWLVVLGRRDRDIITLQGQDA